MFYLFLSWIHSFSYASGGCPGEQPGWYNLWARLILDRLEFLKKEIKKWSESNGGLDLHVYQIRYYSFNFVKMKSKFCKIMTLKKKKLTYIKYIILIINVLRNNIEQCAIVIQARWLRALFARNTRDFPWKAILAFSKVWSHFESNVSIYKSNTTFVYFKIFVIYHMFMHVTNAVIFGQNIANIVLHFTGNGRLYL